jgi:uncharacterized repeat protein (TIGR03803 family)
LYSFTNGLDGAFPYAPLIQGLDGNFYGTASAAGSNDYGTVFKFALSGGCNSNFMPQVSAIQIAGTNVVITLPTVPCQTYQLQYSDAMVPTNWTNIGSAVPGTGNPIQVIDVGGAPVFRTVTWQDLPWPDNLGWGSHGSPATTNGNVITLTGQDVLSTQSFSAPSTIFFNVFLPSETTQNGAFEFFFVPTGEATNLTPNPDIELDIIFPEVGQGGLQVQRNGGGGNYIWGPNPFTLATQTVYQVTIGAAENGLVSWAINGQTIALSNSVVMPYSNYQIRLSSWQPTQVWQVSKFAVIAGPLQRFYRAQVVP